MTFRRIIGAALFFSVVILISAALRIRTPIETITDLYTLWFFILILWTLS